MSALGHERTFRDFRMTSALPPKADIAEHDEDVRFVPKADIVRCGERRRYSMTSSATASSADGTVRPSALAVFALMTSSNLVDT
jgi:hypothetical protein